MVTTYAPMIRAEVAARRPVDGRERDSIAEFLDRLDRLERPFDEHADQVHVTASSLVVSERGVVLPASPRLGMWLQPGGHVDAGETPWDAAPARGDRGDRPADRALDRRAPGAAARRRPRRAKAPPAPRPALPACTPPPVDPTPPEGESQDVRLVPVAPRRGRRRSGSRRPAARPAARARRSCVRRATATPATSPPCSCARGRSPCRRSHAVHDEADVRRWIADEVIGHRDVTVAELDGTIVGWMVLDGGVASTAGSTSCTSTRRGSAVGSGCSSSSSPSSATRSGCSCGRSRSTSRRSGSTSATASVAVERTSGAGNEERAPDVRFEWSPRRRSAVSGDRRVDDRGDLSTPGWRSRCSMR